MLWPRDELPKWVWSKQLKYKIPPELSKWQVNIHMLACKLVCLSRECESLFVCHTSRALPFEVEVGALWWLKGKNEIINWNRNVSYTVTDTLTCIINWLQFIPCTSGRDAGGSWNFCESKCIWIRNQLSDPGWTVSQFSSSVFPYWIMQGPGQMVQTIFSSHLFTCRWLVKNSFHTLVPVAKVSIFARQHSRSWFAPRVQYWKKNGQSQDTKILLQLLTSEGIFFILLKPRHKVFQTRIAGRRNFVHLGIIALCIKLAS